VLQEVVQTVRALPTVPLPM